MVNEEYYALLKKGVQGWNDWIAKNLGIIPDLSYAHLNGADLNRADLQGTDLNGADLSYAHLNGANLIGANLIGANLRGANLTGANLIDADLMGADLRGADLRGGDLKGVYLIRANLCNTDLRKTDLRNTRLNGADLSGANLRGLDLRRVDLNGANLTGANLTGAELCGANLNGANLTGAELIGANLSRTQALETDFTNTKFTGACLEDWNINSGTKLNNIDCQYVYLKNNKQERRPSSREFAPGEFSKVIQKALNTVDLFFTDGIDWKAFLLSFQELQAEYGEENLSVQAIEKKSGGAFVIRLEVPPEANKADIEFREKELYQRQILLMEGQLKDKENLLNDYKKIVDDTRKHNTDLTDIIKTLADNKTTININMEAQAESNSMSESYQSKYDQRNSNNQFVDTAQSGSNPTFNQSNYAPEQRQNLAEAAADIEQLLTQLQTQGYSQEQAQQQAAQDLSKKAGNDPTILGKLVKWGESLSDTAAKTTVTEAAKEVFKIALRLSGIPIP